MNESFGKAIKRHRKKANLTQEEVILRVNDRLKIQGVSDLLTQATLSGWETGRQMPSGKAALLDALKEEIELPPEVIANIQGQTGKRGGRAPNDEYGDDIEEWVKLATANPLDKEDNPRIWFLAPNKLPALTDRSGHLTHIWGENLVQGVQYRIFWILEEMEDSGLFRQLHDVLDSLYKRLSKPEDKQNGSLVDTKEVVALTGTEPSTNEVPDGPAEGREPLRHGDIRIYLINRPAHVIRQAAASEDAMAESKEMFEEMCKKWNQPHRTWKGELETANWISWHKLEQFKDAKDEGYNEEVHQLDRKIYDRVEKVRSQLIGRLAIYLSSRGSKQAAQAGVLLTGTSARFKGEPSQVYRWFQQEVAEGFGRQVALIESWIEKREK